MGRAPNRVVKWSCCFTLILICLGLPSQKLFQYTEHVWTSCISRLKGTWEFVLSDSFHAKPFNSLGKEI